MSSWAHHRRTTDHITIQCRKRRSDASHVEAFPNLYWSGTPTQFSSVRMHVLVAHSLCLLASLLPYSRLCTMYFFHLEIQLLFANTSSFSSLFLAFFCKVPFFSSSLSSSRQDSLFFLFPLFLSPSLLLLVWSACCLSLLLLLFFSHKSHITCYSYPCIIHLLRIAPSPSWLTW